MPSEQGDTKRTTCPTCGSPVTVVSADEGTGHYEPERSASGPPDEYRAWLVKSMDWAVEMALQYAGTEEVVVKSKSHYYGDLYWVYRNALGFYDGRDAAPPEGWPSERSR